MKHCNTILPVHEGLGTTQNDRVKPTLDVNFFLLDERNEQDFILFVQRLSEYVKFYDKLNSQQGNWASFFQKESTSILIYIVSWHIELLQNSFEIKKNEIYLNTNPASQKNLLLDYFTLFESEFEDVLKRANHLDDAIIEKQNLIASSYIITNAFASIFNQINGTTNITSLLKNYVFTKTSQQLFGLLLSWKDFSKKAITYQLESYSEHHPHYTLFLSFLKLLQVAKDKFNEFTKRHLDFYYKDVLRIENKEVSPDYVHLVAEPFKTTVPFLIPKDKVYLGGENSKGQKKYYASTANQTINQNKLHSFLSYHHHKDNSYYTATDLLSINAKNIGFNVFTNDKAVFKEGLMVASPILYLQSGERFIYLRLNDKNYNPNIFSFYITGKEESIEITQKSIVTKMSDARYGYIKLIIPAIEKAIIPFDSEIHTDFLVASEFPVLKIVPKNRAVITAIQKIDITVEVKQFKSFVLESDFGIIDLEKPFYPFGEFPKNTNGVVLSSNEFFMKNKAIASLEFTSDLEGLAPVRLSYSDSSKNATKTEKTVRKDFRQGDVHTEYVMSGDKTSAKKYHSSLNQTGWIKDKVNVFNLNNGQWKTYSGSLPKTIHNNYPLKEYHFDEVATENIVSNGKFRIELDNSNYGGQTYMQNYIIASKNLTTLPYKPRVKKFIFNYEVSETIDLTSRKNENNPVDIFHVLPYGYAEKQIEVLRFSSLNTNEGFVYLGFEDTMPKDGLNFLIQLEEGTANPLLEPATVTWEYLSDNDWHTLETNAMGDETYSLTQSGIITISVPEFNALTNTRLDAHIFWLRVSVSDIQAICKFIGIHAQAFKAKLITEGNLGTEFLETTAKETISKAFKTVKGIKAFSQPYDSFEGRTIESDEALYIRTSERLRHKYRAITKWDYENIVLEEFPEVYRVKALNHYRFDKKTSNVSAGYVTLIPISKLSVSEVIHWKPLLSLNKMMRIKEFLSKIASPHARIQVKPPKLEKVEVHCSVKYHENSGMDTRLYNSQLIETINTYFSPWAYGDIDDIRFAGNIEFSSIIQLIDNQSYVDYVTDFKVTQYILDENNEVIGSAVENLSKITPQSDFTLFIPTETHDIQKI